MPTLSLTPMQSGPSPETDLAGVNGGTEGREGSNTAASNSGNKEVTWTRLFQSYIQQNKQTVASPQISTVKSDTPKAKPSGDSADSPVSAPSIAVTPASLPDPTVIAANPILVSPLVTMATQASFTAKSNSTGAVANTPAARPVPTAVPTPPSLLAAAPAATTLATPIAVSVQSSVIVPAQSAPQAAVPTQALPTNTPLTVQALQQKLTVPQDIPVEVISALSNAQLSTVKAGAGPGAIQATSSISNSGSSNGLAKATMERSQVLGETTSPLKPLGAREESKDSGAGTSSEDSPQTGDGSGSGSQAAASGADFTSAMTGAMPSTASPTVSANASLVLGSSQAERVQVVNQISQQIQAMQPATSNPNTMTVTVQPPHWGQVTVSVSLSPTPLGQAPSGNISATVTASTSEVQGVLQQHVQDLKDSLANAGLHLDKLDVGVGTVTAASQAGSSSGHHAGQQGAGSQQQSYQSASADGSSLSGNSSNGFQSSFGSGDDTGGSSTAQAVPVETASMSAAVLIGAVTETSHIDMRA